MDLIRGGTNIDFDITIGNLLGLGIVSFEYFSNISLKRWGFAGSSKRSRMQNGLCHIALRRWLASPDRCPYPDLSRGSASRLFLSRYKRKTYTGRDYLSRTTICRHSLLGYMDGSNGEAKPSPPCNAAKPKHTEKPKLGKDLISNEIAESQAWPHFVSRFRSFAGLDQRTKYSKYKTKRRFSSGWTCNKNLSITQKLQVKVVNKLIFPLKEKVMYLTKFYSGIIQYSPLFLLLLGVQCSSCSMKMNDRNETLSGPTSNLKLISINDDQGSNILWRGISGTSQITITEGDIIVGNKARDENVLSDYVRQVSSHDRKSLNAKNGCEERFEFMPLSLVGGVLSVKQSSITVCDNGGNPGREVIWLTIDLGKSGAIPYSYSNGLDIRKPSRLAKITDYFPDDVVLNRLLEVAEIRSEIGQESISLASTNELIKRLEDVGFGKDGASKLTVESLYSFSFERIESDLVVVRLALFPMGRRFRVDFIELRLPLSGKFQREIELAGSGQGGFLGNEANNLIKKVISFTQH